MDKLEGTSMDITKENIEKLKELFPNCVTEGKIDFDMLQIILGEEIDNNREKYQFTWNGKNAAIKLTQTPSSSTLRPNKEKSKNWDTTQNLYIEGDNLEALKQLQKTYFGKIKMIYIDPPYNTGGDFVYKDNFVDSINNYREQTNQTTKSNPETSGRFHTDWLNMMYPRLVLARNLLSIDGAIVISIDDNELANLIKICNEIFGEANQIAVIILENDSRARPYDAIATTHEYIVIYAKSDELELNFMSNKDKSFAYYDKEGGFDLYELRNRNIAFNISNRPNLYYPFYLNPNKCDDNQLYEISLDEKDGWVQVYPQESNNIKTVWRWGRDKAAEYLNTILFGKKSATGNWQIVKKYRENTYTLNSVWTDKEFSSDRGTLEVKKLFNNEKVFDFPKPVDLIKRFIILLTDEKDIILDFFSGSGTTAQAVLSTNMDNSSNRHFILVQLPELVKENSAAKKLGFSNLCDIGEERIRRAGDKLKKEWEDSNNSDGLFADETKEFPVDIGFKVFKLDSTNINPWDNEQVIDDDNLFDTMADVFKSDRSKEDILYEIMLKYGVFDMPVSEIRINGKTMYKVGFRYMLVCLDDSVTEEDVKAIGNEKPRVVVFNEAGFANDNDKINAVYNLTKAGVEDIKCI